MDDSLISVEHKQTLASIAVQMLGWILAFELLVLLRFFGLESIQAFQGLDLTQLDRSFYLKLAVIAGSALGLIFGLIDVWLSHPRLRQMPYGWLILSQSGVHIALLALVLGSVRAAEMLRDEGGFALGLWLERLASTNLLVVLLYTGVVSLFFNFVKHVNRKFGPGNLVKILLGRYYRPREEERIFMFLDLQASTTHAEKLGHIVYSCLIQDCFRDLAVVLQNSAEVYQYVGDEAVLCWTRERGLEDANCLKAFVNFDDQIHSREAHYLSHYGFVPIFKAGLNSGLVTVAEVGEIKREIAFHGDVLNTAARIQSKCNELGQRLLVSEYLKRQLGPAPGFRFEELGSVELRGRLKTVNVYGVTRADG